MQADLNMLQEACAIHKRILVGNDLVEQMGGPQRLTALGFLLADRSSRSAKVVRYNPRQVVINRWKSEVQDLGRYFRSEFPPELVGELFEVVRPEHWLEGHPYRGLLKADCEVVCSDDGRRHWGSHRRRPSGQANLTDAPGTILTFVQLARKLGRGGYGKPWRRACQWKELLERLVEYVHGVERSGDEDWRRLARWVRSESRAAGVKVPRKKKLPPRPAFGKKAARRRRKPQPVPV
jgi:hypothetical protein